MSSPLAEGLYEQLITRAVRAAIEALPVSQRHATTAMQLDWVDEALARHVAKAVRSALSGMPQQPSASSLALRAGLVARVLAAVGEGYEGDVPEPTRDALTWVGPRDPGLAEPSAPERPEHGLVHPSLLFNGQQDVSLLHELQREIASADRIDAIVAFLKFSGVNLLRPSLATFFARGGVLRLVASTYVGATDARAVESLARMRGAKVRLAYEEEGTRLHAKAWLFHRRSGLSTAYIGSSNLSKSALTDGAEWNVRVTQATTPALVERFSQAFEQFWEAVGPEDFHPSEHAERLARSLARARGDKGSGPVPFLRIDAEPKPHQVRVLEALEAERRHGHHHNLVVAATGTGKTWVSAFDYQRLRREGTVDRVLFVAHRREILEQSLGVFRTVLKDRDFGELRVGGHRPGHGHHVFASIQSLTADTLEALAPDHFDMVIIDEFHHAAADSYTALLNHLNPKVLLGLTATPERADGKSVLSWFGGRTAAEIRLWDALDEGLLVPFHYFGVFDPTSAESAWQRGRLQEGALGALYTGDHARAKRVLRAVDDYVADPSSMRALGFCVGVGHAERMAAVFSEAGLASEAVHGGTPADQRDAAIRRLRSGELRALFSVDLFNEGVDIPEVDTVLFLRPTESATVFLQQLGRGLRHHHGKGHLLALDFVGHVHQDYRYETRYRALLGGTRKQVRDHIARGFPKLPPGCAIQLERAAQEVVLGGIKKVVGSGGWRQWSEELQRMGPTATLADFLVQTDADLTDVFQPQHAHGRTWSLLRRHAGFEDRPEQEGEKAFRKCVGRMLHVDDDLRLDTWSHWLSRSTPPRFDALDQADQALARMLFAAMGFRRRPLADLEVALAEFWRCSVVREELGALLSVLKDGVRHAPNTLDAQAPLASHGTYTRAEVIAAFGVTGKGGVLRESREGPVWMEDHQTDVFFVTLDKSDDVFTPSIRYADYPISSQRFHWESQNNTHDGTPVGQRYVHHIERGSSVILMVRERPKDDRGETLPFTCLGTVVYERHRGAKPMEIVWRLDRPMPAWVLQKGRALAA